MNGKSITSLMMCLLCMVLVSCQYQYVSGKKLGLRDYPDSVVHISQVDPAYRSHFAAQHGSSFSLRDQRAAFTKANETARTPVNEAAYRPVSTASRRRAVSRGKGASSRRKVARGRKTTVRGRGAATRKKGKAASRKKATSRKPARRRRK